MLYLRRISGNSMLPTLHNGDYIVALRRVFTTYKCNEIIIVKHTQYGEIIKRIAHIDVNNQYWLSGDGCDSLSSQAMGAIPKDKVLGALLWHIASQ